MFAVCRVCRFDSFKAARGDVRALFAPFLTHSTTPQSVSAEQVERRVRQYILTQSRTLQRAGTAQQRSWVRANVSLVLREARTVRCSPVAFAALRVALEESKLLATIDSVWLKDAAAACTGVDELRELQALLQQYSTRLEPGTSSQNKKQQHKSIHGDLLAMLIGGSAGTDSALSSIAVPEGANEAQAITTAADVREATHALQSAPNTMNSVNSALTLNALQEEERRVVNALTPHRPQPVGVDVVSGEQRILRGLRRLQEQREVSCALAPNQSFIRYFQKQGIVHNEAEVIALFQAMKRRRTVATFRVRRGHVYSRAVEDMLLARREGISRIDWLPRSFAAYAMNCGADVSYDALLANRQLLKALSKERLLSYQNIASMLPVYFLQPMPGERILDLCAAPGSKTSLLLDCLHDKDSNSEAARGAGCVVANEAHEGRSAELGTRLRNCDVRLAVTRMRGESLGQLTHDSQYNNATTNEGGLHVNESGSEACYDKVLVDAPCSAEGRMGQDAMLWRLWHPCKGLEFFARQVSLLQRAVRLCRPGGLVLYATCTLNPIENEAVVAAVLRMCGGSVELCPPPSLPTQGAHTQTATQQEEGQNKILTSNKEEEDDEDCGVPPLELSCGLHTWYVPSREGGFYHVWSEAVARGETDRLRPELFAPGCTTNTISSDCNATQETNIAEQLRCCCRRVLPHRNPGAEGFFFALLRVKGSVSEYTSVNSRLSASQNVFLPSSQPHMPPPPSQTASLRLSRQSIFYDRGLVTLPATHHTVQQQLGPFFFLPKSSLPLTNTSRTTDYRNVADFLAREQLEVVWHGEEGLRLVSQDAVRAVKQLTTSTIQNRHGRNATNNAITSYSATRGALLELGVLTLDAHGVLTSDGACVLRAHATSRVLPVPLPQVQLLLAQGTLRLSRHEAEAEASALRALYPLSPTLSVTNDATLSNSCTYEWMAEVQRSVMQCGGSGNAIVVIANDVLDIRSGRSRPLEPWRRALLQPWAIPVRVEVESEAQTTTSVRQHEHQQQDNKRVYADMTLHLLLSSEARQRCAAMLGRIEAAWQRQATRHAATLRARLQEMSTQDVSNIMSPNVLHGTPVTSPHNLFTNAAAITNTTNLSASSATQSEAGAMYERVVEV